MREEVEASKPSKECHFWSLSIIASKPSPDSRGEDITNTGAACTTVWGRLIWGHLGRLGVASGRVPMVALPVHALLFLNI